jgi:hypothetical protein
MYEDIWKIAAIADDADSVAGYELYVPATDFEAVATLQCQDSAALRAPLLQNRISLHDFLHVGALAFTGAYAGLRGKKVGTTFWWPSISTDGRR